MFNLFLRFQVAFGLKNMVILSRLTDTDLRGVRESREWEKRDGPSRGGGVGEEGTQNISTARCV